MHQEEAQKADEMEGSDCVPEESQSEVCDGEEEPEEPEPQPGELINNEDGQSVGLRSWDYAASDRTKCFFCHRPINKGDVRLAFQSKVGSTPRLKKWLHIDCCVKLPLASRPVDTAMMERFHRNVLAAASGSGVSPIAVAFGQALTKMREPP